MSTGLKRQKEMIKDVTTQNKTKMDLILPQSKLNSSKYTGAAQKNKYSTDIINANKTLI
jgi:hypothetical protein